jgi:hypothetical protein
MNNMIYISWLVALRFIIKSLYCQTCDLRTTNKLLYYIWHHAYLSNHHNVKLDLIATNRLVIISYDTMFIYQIIIVKHVTLEPPISLCISYYSFDVINSPHDWQYNDFIKKTWCHMIYRSLLVALRSHVWQYDDLIIHMVSCHMIYRSLLVALRSHVDNIVIW